MGIIKILAKTKLRYIYATSWFNIFGMPLLVANLLQQKLELIGISINFIVIMIVGIIGLGITGLVMDRIGLFEEEVTYTAERNREIQDIKKKMGDQNGSNGK